MASYKVPQDVEADDKLIGPFSFRQFIYLIIIAGAIAIAWVLAQVFVGLAVIPLPVILFFGALALPLRKDQPMETYMAAIVSFYLKPHKRMWDPDGQQALVEITAPKRIEERNRIKDISESEAEKRLSYLASVVDSRGWAVRGVQAPTVNTSMNTDVYYEAQQTEDILDTSGQTFHQIETRLDQTDERRRQEIIQRMNRQSPQQAVVQPQQTTSAQPAQTATPTFNPYPQSIQQSVIQPLSAQQQVAAIPQPQVQTQTPSTTPVSPDIINLANNPDLSIETIAHEANRIKEKEGLPKDEVVISLH